MQHAPRIFSLNRAISCVLVLLAPAILQAQEPDAIPVRVALVVGVGARAPSEGLSDLLLADLSERADVLFVERGAVDQVLAEQSLSLDGLTAPGTAISVGRLLAADLLLCVDAFPGDVVSGIRIRIIESRTGITLAADEFPSDTLDTELKAAREAFDRALPKARIAADNRLYVGIVGFRNEDLGRELNGVADALSPMLAVTLAREPSVVLLDREQLDALTEEHRLTGLDLDLRTSALAVSGGIRADHDRGGWLISLRLHSTGIAETAPTLLHVPDADIRTARQLLAEAMLSHSGSDTIAAPPMSTENEAGQYARQVELLTQKRYDRLFTGEYLRGQRESPSRHAPLAEAAYALHPTQKHRAMVASLASDPRGIELLAEYWREQTRNIDTADNPILSFTLEPPGGNFAPDARPWPDAMIALQQEMLLRELAWQVGHSSLNEWHFSLAAAFRSFQFWCADVGEWGHYVKSLYGLGQVVRTATGSDTSLREPLHHMVIEVSDMLGDTARGGIWLCVASGTPAGVLFVEPSSRSNDTADWIGQQRFRRSGRRLDWFGSQIRLTSLGGMSKFDPATDRVVNLLSPAASAFGPGSREVEISAIVGDALITRARRDGVLMLDTGSSGRGALLRTLPDGKQPRIEHMVQVSPDEAIIGDRAGNLWRIVAPEHDRYAARILYVQPMGDTWQELLDRPDRISPANTAASDHHDGHPPDMLVDGNARTCWGADSESSENWIEFTFDDSATIGSLALLNGWMPDQRGTKRYDANHRARRVRLQHDDRRRHNTWQLRDVSIPQILRLPEPITARKVRLTIEAVYEAEIIDAQTPPRLVMSQVLFFQTALPELK